MADGAAESEADIIKTILQTLDKIAWNVGSALIAKIHNANVTKRSDAITPDQINPYSERKSSTRGTRLTRQNVVGIFAAFAKQKHHAT